jgi:Ca-activated chloride channel family protein
VAIALVLIVVSLARPFIGKETIKITRDGRDILALVDVSTSMLAADLSPNRLGAARRKLQDLALLSRANGDRVGIVLFAGDAYLYCPLTTDLNVLALYLESIEPGLIGSGGSSLDRAVDVSIESFIAVQSKNPVIVLLSDGESSEQSLSNTAQKLADAGVTLHALGFGSESGVAIDLGRGRMVRDTWGNLVISKRNDANLTTLATGSGGRFLLPTVDDSDLRTFLPSPLNSALVDGAVPNSQIANGEASDQIEIYREVGSWGALLALLLIVGFVLKERRMPLLVGIFVVGVSGGSAAADDVAAPNIAAQGSKALAAEEFAEAAKLFAEALKKDPKNAALHRSLGSAQYRSKNYDGAADSFRKGASSATNGRERFYNLYNLGNTEMQRGRFAEALKAYDEALTVKPEDQNTLQNRQLAERLLSLTPTPPPTPSTPPEQNEQTPQPTPSVPQTPESSPSPSETPDGAGTPPTPSGTPPVQTPAPSTPQPDGNPPSGTPDPSQTPPSDQDQQSGSPTPQPTSNGPQEGTPQSTPEPSESPSPTAGPGAGTPTNGATPTPSTAASAGPTVRPSPNTAGTPQIPDDAALTPRPTPSPLPIVTIDPNEEAMKDPEAPKEYDETALKREEAEQWLKSLGRSPIMTRRQRRGLNLGGQTW